MSEIVDVLIDDGKMIVIEPRRCKTCRWWEQAIYLPSSIDPRPGYGECAKARARGDVEDGALAFAFESNSWSADLITAADFGCVQWQSEKATGSS